MTDTRPLILVTNDDGITSPGLQAAVEAALPLGEILVVAPSRQWSGAGRSMPWNKGYVTSYAMTVAGRSINAYQADASPALIILYAILEMVDREPSLIISGVNFGENLGTDVTISGTVGATLQAAVCGIPALATSLQTPKDTHIALSNELDFAAAVHFTRMFARCLLNQELPQDVDILKLDVPESATPETPWRLTRASRHPYFVTIPLNRAGPTQPMMLDYAAIPDPQSTEPNSDIHAVAADRVVSITPLSIDLTSRTDFDTLEALLREQE